VISIALYLAHAAFLFWINQRGWGRSKSKSYPPIFLASGDCLVAGGQDDVVTEENAG